LVQEPPQVGTQLNSLSAAAAALLLLFFFCCCCFAALAEEDDGDDDDEAIRVWNLRKCSAAALDMLSNNLNDEHILPLLLPIVQQRLADPDWRVRESAILALGAVSEGCHMGLAPYLTDMVKMMIPVLQVGCYFVWYFCFESWTGCCGTLPSCVQPFPALPRTGTSHILCGT
jgi:hypothetical protein